nr:hypothetical protein [Oscillibacter sp.]
MKAQAGEVYTVYNRYLKCYTACQVAYIAPPDTVSRESWAVILSLDWAGDAPLTAEELPHLRPLYKDFMYWPRGPPSAAGADGGPAPVYAGGDPAALHRPALPLLRRLE